MVYVHREAFVCAKAETTLHPDHEDAKSVLRRHWWALRSLVAVRARLAERCPDVAAGRAKESLVIRDAEFTTTDHRPLALRILLAACTCCTDPEEPTMNQDPTSELIINEANILALGRLRYYAEDNGVVASVFRDYDHAVAEGLGAGVSAVPALTGTEEVPDPDAAEFEKLLAASSTGPLDADRYRKANADWVFSLLRGAMRDIVLYDDPASVVDTLADAPESITSHMRPALAVLLRLMDDADEERKKRQAIRADKEKTE